MPDATTSGSDATANGSAKSRDHKQGNQNRAYTPQQKEAVVRVRKCSHTAYYEILGVEKTVSDGEIKKAYRKLSLLTHPDKNGYDGADEAFKMVSRAFQVLSDPDKKSRFDKFGGDPDSRFGAGGAATSPFSGFGRPGPGGRGPMFEDEISPEELFNRFFGGQGFGFGGPDMFGGPGGTQFVFNMGGGPGIRVHQFGGGRPRRRPREANGEQEDEPPSSLVSLITNLLPIIILFVLPLLSSVFSGGDSASSVPEFRFQPTPPYDSLRTTHKRKLEYYVNERDVVDFPTRKVNQLDDKVEQTYISTLQYQCQGELQRRNQLMQQAQGWFFQDSDLLNQARNMELTSCKRLENLGISMNNLGTYY